MNFAYLLLPNKDKHLARNNRFLLVHSRIGAKCKDKRKKRKNGWKEDIHTVWLCLETSLYVLARKVYWNRFRISTLACSTCCFMYSHSRRNLEPRCQRMYLLAVYVARLPPSSHFTPPFARSWPNVWSAFIKMLFRFMPNISSALVPSRVIDVPVDRRRKTECPPAR